MALANFSWRACSFVRPGSGSRVSSVGRMTLQTIRKRADFLRANKGLRVAKPGFVLLVSPNGQDAARFGVTVTKKIGNAVVRNRMKRRLRELARAALPQAALRGHDHVLIGREGGVERDFAALREELDDALVRLSAGMGDARRPPRRKPAGARG